MKFDFNGNLIPYRIDGEKADEYNSRLRIFSWELFALGKTHFSDLFLEKFKKENSTDSDKKSMLIELLMIGVLIKCHSRKELANPESTQGKSSQKLQTETELDEFGNSALNFALDFSLADLQEMMNFLEITNEHVYELRVVEKWFTYWQQSGNEIYYSNIVKILLFADFFIEYSPKYLGKFFNDQFFKQLPGIDIQRDDYFQITKSFPEYCLNAVSALWLNELNQEVFDSSDVKRIMVPGCMRFNNGKSCEAVKMGSYLRCSACNTSCNAYKLTKFGETSGIDVLIAVHQSTFKADQEQLKNSGIVGIACMSCLLSGGLMLKEKGIHAVCVTLDRPGCIKHWTKEGVMTNINYPELMRLIGLVTKEKLSTRLTA
jgi:hypothetical protein